MAPRRVERAARLGQAAVEEGEQRLVERRFVGDELDHGRSFHWGPSMIALLRFAEVSARCARETPQRTLGPWGIQMVNDVMPASLVA